MGLSFPACLRLLWEDVVQVESSRARFGGLIAGFGGANGIWSQYINVFGLLYFSIKL